MSEKPAKNQSIGQQILSFIIHLRWHYQVFILSGGFLMGGYFSPEIDWSIFFAQFCNVHLLLFGGATAYNSYWDKDEGPVGGLKHPPAMTAWMWTASLGLQLAGLVISFYAGLIFAIIYAISMLFFWLYSTPHFRWKGTPVRSLIAIGISTGTNSLLMGFLAAGNQSLTSPVVVAAVGVAAIILSLYPPSQLFQLEEDQHRGDRTFALAFGFNGVIQFYRISFSAGLILIGLSMIRINWAASAGFIIAGLAIGIKINRALQKLKTQTISYESIMHIKYFTSLGFVSYITLLLCIKHFF